MTAEREERERINAAVDHYETYGQYSPATYVEDDDDLSEREEQVSA